MRNLNLLVMAFFIFSDQLIAQTKSIKKSPIFNETNPGRTGISLERFAGVTQMYEQNVDNENMP